jgi:hypothetical protein
LKRRLYWFFGLWAASVAAILLAAAILKMVFGFIL